MREVSSDYSSNVGKSGGDFRLGDIVVQYCRRCIVKLQAVSGW